MKKGFTIIEVSILFVIFLIVAFLVAPLSIDDTIQAKYISRWRNVQEEFSNMFYSVNPQEDTDKLELQKNIENIIENNFKTNIKPYKISYLNGHKPNPEHQFANLKITDAKASIAYKFYDNAEDGILGIIMYDVNGQSKPNTWGKDIFGFNIYSDRFETFCKKETLNHQKHDCSKNGTGLCCSNYYLIGGKFE